MARTPAFEAVPLIKPPALPGVSDLCGQWKGELREFNGEGNHVPLVVDYPPDVRLSELVNNLKSVSSCLIRKEFTASVNRFYSQPVFWTASYFVASCGGVTLEQLKTYVEKQSSPAL